jgi:toluene monooxygenase electron transfer component
MFQIQIDGSTKQFSCEKDDTLLRAALRAGIGFPYECNVGSCGNCKFELIEGDLQKTWEEAPGLSEKDRNKNRWLGCQSKPCSDARIKMREMEQYVPLHPPVKTKARLSAKRAITHDLHEFSFTCDEPLTFASGQYALIHFSGVAGPRAYSMSQAGSCTKEVDFQVRIIPGGSGTEKLFTMPLGEEVQIDGPYGMAYLRENAPRDILLVGGGSGLAPMISLARGALALKDPSFKKIHFIYGARESRDICGLDMLQELPNWNHVGQYTAVVSNAPPEQTLPEGTQRGFVHEAVQRLHAENLGQMEIYFAGPALMAQAMIKLLVDHKVPMNQVHFDQFY